MLILNDRRADGKLARAAMLVAVAEVTGKTPWRIWSNRHKKMRTVKIMWGARPEHITAGQSVADVLRLRLTAMGIKNFEVVTSFNPAYSWVSGSIRVRLFY